MSVRSDKLQVVALDEVFPGDTKGNQAAMVASLVKGSKIHENIAQDYITTTTDRLKLRLIEHGDHLRAKDKWVAPTTLLFTLLAVLVSADFKEGFGLSADTWRAVFVIGLVASVLWLGRSLVLLYKSFRRGNLDDLIGRIKSESGDAD